MYGVEFPLPLLPVCVNKKLDITRTVIFFVNLKENKFIFKNKIRLVRLLKSLFLPLKVFEILDRKYYVRKIYLFLPKEDYAQLL